MVSGESVWNIARLTRRNRFDRHGIGLNVSKEITWSVVEPTQVVSSTRSRR
jgi:hypothetical protein